MNKKLVTMGMIIPLAATGAVISAPAASAHPNHRNVTESDDCNRDRDRLTLRAKLTNDHDDIKLTLALRTTQNRSHDRWTVVLRRQNPNRHIFLDTNVSDGDFFSSGSGRRTFVTEETVNNRFGADHFVARVVNHRTGQDCDVRLTIGGSRNND